MIDVRGSIMDIRGWTPLSLLDYPGKLACVVFCGGCNFRCGYCHNPVLVLGPESQPLFSEQKILNFLKIRAGKLDAVVLSGGEPTIHGDLPQFMAQIKALGFMVKLDTNGSRPAMIKTCHEQGLLDTVGIDYKAPAARYTELVGCKSKGLADKVRASLRYAVEHGLELDVRTTVHRSLLSVDELRQMRRELDELGVGAWSLQQFSPGEIIDDSLLDQPSYSDDELQAIAESLGNTTVRGAGLLARTG